MLVVTRGIAVSYCIWQASDIGHLFKCWRESPRMCDTIKIMKLRFLSNDAENDARLLLFPNVDPGAVVIASSGIHAENNIQKLDVGIE